MGTLYGGGYGNIVWRGLWEHCVQGAAFEYSVSMQNLRSLSHNDEEVEDLPSEYWNTP